MSHSQKISTFTGQSILDNSDLFTFVRNGTNYNVSLSNFKADLGVTGTINQVGDPLGAPILDKPSATQNNIRNLESSKGVIASVSAQNGINLACNFSQAATGLKLIPDLNADQYKVKTLVAGTNIAINESDDSLIIGFNPDSGSSKTVIVSTISDFPDPVSGVISLVADTDYLMVDDISTTNRFVVSNPNTLRAASSQMVTLEYTGVGDMFTGTDPSFKVFNVTVSAPNGNVFNTTAPSGFGIIQMVESNIRDCQTIGIVLRGGEAELCTVDMEIGLTSIVNLGNK